MAGTLKLMAIFPHPDDETLGLGPTFARYSAEGVETYLVCATRGDQGWMGPPEEDPGAAELGRIREGELRCAAEKLGLHEVVLLNYGDGLVDQATPQTIINELVTHIRRVRPQVVVTFGYDGSYGHPDHIALAQITAAALICSADRTYTDPSNQAAHRVSKFYHMVDSRTLVDSLQETIGGISMEVDGVERQHIGWDDWAITTQIDTSEYFQTMWNAVLCHQSQLPGYGPFVDLPKEVLAGLFQKGNFIRVFSLVNGGRKVENDLFEGLR